MPPASEITFVLTNQKSVPDTQIKKCASSINYISKIAILLKRLFCVYPRHKHESNHIQSEHVLPISEPHHLNFPKAFFVFQCLDETSNSKIKIDSQAHKLESIKSQWIFAYSTN